MLEEPLKSSQADTFGLDNILKIELGISDLFEHFSLQPVEHPLSSVARIGLVGAQGGSEHLGEGKPLPL
jgi:hypothetical protein